MKVFKIKNDTNNIQQLQPVDHSKITLERFKFECESKKDSWEEMLYYVNNPKTKSKNFYSFSSGTLACDDETLEICRTVFEMSGEILSIQLENGPKLYVLNILECVNGLDYENTIWDYYDDGTKGRILKYSMHHERILNESTIFKIPETAKTDIFCYSDIKDPEDEFYYIYKSNNLTGLLFEEVYSSEL